MSVVKPKNKNYLGKDGFIYNVYEGDQSISRLKKAKAELLVLVAIVRKKHKPVLILTDIRNLGKVNLSARTFAVEFVKTVDFDKVAIFGNPLAVAHLVNFIITASGMGFKMKYFDNAEDARQWLLRD